MTGVLIAAGIVAGLLLVIAAAAVAIAKWSDEAMDEIMNNERSNKVVTNKKD